MSEQPEHRVALITGGNRGIGLEIARQLARQGQHVILGARNRAHGERSAGELTDLGYRSTAVELDVTDPGSIDRAIPAIVRRFGRIDVLVNNAGIAIDGPDHRPSHPDFDRVKTSVNTNLFGAWACAAAVAPHMRAAGYGRIVNMSSNMASLTLTDDDESPAYRISKAALNMLTVVLAAELREDGILVNAASPGYTRTDMSPNATRTVPAGSGYPGLAGHPALGRPLRRVLLRKGTAALVMTEIETPAVLIDLDVVDANFSLARWAVSEGARRRTPPMPVRRRGHGNQVGRTG